MSLLRFGPELVTLPWTAPDGQEFSVDLVFEGPVPATGRIECVAFTLRSIGHDEMPVPASDAMSVRRKPPILARYMREFPLGNLVDRERRQLTQLLLKISTAEISSKSKFVKVRPRIPRSALRTLAQGDTARPGRQNLDKALLMEVAEIYWIADKAGENPSAAVAEHFERPQSTANKWVQAARRHGYLPRTVSGKRRSS